MILTRILKRAFFGRRRNLIANVIKLLEHNALLLLINSRENDLKND